MKRIITIIAVTACAAVLMNSCQKSLPEVKEGVPMKIQASVVAPPETKTIYEYTDDKTLEGFWNEEEAITVVSFGENGITAVDKFTSVGWERRTKAEFSGTWHGKEGDRVICLYPAVDSYVGISIFDDVSVGDPFINIKGFSAPSKPLQHDDTGAVSNVDLMLGEVRIGDNDDDEDYWDDDDDYSTKANEGQSSPCHVYLEHLFAVFRIEVTLKNFSYEASAASPYDMAKINTIRIKCVDPNTEMDDWDDPVFVVSSHLNVTTDDYNGYTGMPVTDEKRPLDYYLLTSGDDSDLYLTNSEIKNGKVVEKTFFVPVRFDSDLKAGYELHFQFGGNYFDYKTQSRKPITVFPNCDKQVTIEETLPLKNGKIYCFKVTI